MNLTDWFERLRLYGLEMASKRFYSKYMGKVTSNADPQQQGRVKVMCEQLGKTEPYARYAYPSSPYAGQDHGMYFPPEIGSSVWTWFEFGDATQPHYSGGWWGNSGAGDPKPSVTSQVPAEFRATAPDFIPTKRGIKTAAGHGLVFEDGPDEASVEVWTGTQVTPNVSAVRNNRIRLDDAHQRITVITKGQHYTVWSDKPTEVYVRTETVAGHKVYLDDTLKRILIQSTNGHTVLLDDTANTASLATAGGHKVVADDSKQSVSMITATENTIEASDATGSVSMRTRFQRSVALSDITGTTTLETPLGQTVVQSVAGTTITDPAAVAVVAAGALSLTGGGLNMTSAGGAPTVQNATGTSVSNFTGDKTENFQGAFTQVIQGTWAILAGVAQILSGVGVEMGFPLGVRYFLVTEAFLTQLYFVHSHTSAAPGSPTGPPMTGVIPQVNLFVPGTHATLGTRAN